MNLKTKGLLLFGAGIFVIQFIPIDRTNPPVQAELQSPEEIKAMLKISCYDCHSNQTDWPWYSYVAPVSFQLNSHIKEGRKRLNFSNWGTYTIEKQKVLATSIVKEVSEGNMPKFPYSLAHPEAKLSEVQQTQLTGWFKSSFEVSQKQAEEHDHDAH